MYNLESYLALCLKETKEFYELTDPGHKQDHVIAVARFALEMNATLAQPLKERVVVAASIWHDIMSTREQRDQHHTLGADYIAAHCFDIDCFMGFTDEEMRSIVAAVREHRASYKGDYTTILSEIISSADRGKPCLDGFLKRCLKINKSHSELTPEENLAIAQAHAKEKYGTGGYARLPALYLNFFSAEIKTMRDQIDVL